MSFVMFTLGSSVKCLAREIGRKTARNFHKNSAAAAGKFVLPLHVLLLKLSNLLGEEQNSAVFESIKRHVCEGDEPVFEMRAGNGILAKKLLEGGVKTLHMFEKRNSCQPILKELQSQYRGRCSLHQRTFNETFFEHNNVPLYNSPFLGASLPVNLKRAWRDSPSLKVVATQSNGKVMIVSLIHLSKNMMYFGMGRPQFLLTLPKSTLTKMQKHPKKANYQDYHAAGLLFPDYFEYEILGNLKPPFYYSTGENTNHPAKEEYLTVSLTPSKELEDIAGPEILEEYLFFGTQTMNGKAKHSIVIPTLEKWLPGSGKQLVAKGLNCFTQFTDLSPREALEIFKIWRTHPNYKSSLFMYEFQDYIEFNKF